MRRLAVLPATLACLALAPGRATAYNQPGNNYNTGFSNFADGGAPPVGYPPGLYIAEVVQLFNATSFYGADHQKLSGRFQASFLVNTNQFIYLPGIKDPLTKSEFGVDLVIPMLTGNLATPQSSQNNTGGLGDIILSPVFQWNNHKLFGLYYYHRFEIHTSFPTGQYDKAFVFNPGSNVFTFAPYYSQSLWLVPYLDLEFSFRHQFRWVTTNPDTHVHAGTMYILNYAASYGLSPNWRVGPIGYLAAQLTDDTLSGQKIDNAREFIFGLGAGVLYNAGPLTLMFQFYDELAAENRPQGLRVQWRLVYKAF